MTPYEVLFIAEERERKLITEKINRCKVGLEFLRRHVKEIKEILKEGKIGLSNYEQCKKH